MNVVIISCVFPPEPIISAQTSSQIANELFSLGNDITVITSFPNRPSGFLFPGFRRGLYLKQKSKDGIYIIRCFSFFSRKSSIISRTLENISFGLSSGFYLLFLKRPDLVYANTWPIVASGIVRLITLIKRVPLIISVQDVYPESLVVQGRISKSGFLEKIITSIDRWVASGCSIIVTISKSFADIYQNTRGISKEKIVTIPNWVDKSSIELLSQKLFRDEIKIPLDAFVIVYGGNIGVAAGLEKFIKAIGNIKSKRNIFFIIAGSGSQLEECKQAAKEKPWINFVFLSPWAQEDTSKVLASADILLLPTSGDQSMVSVPSKLISYLLASRPVLAVSRGKSEISNIINTTNCGWVIHPEKLQEVNNFIETLIELPELTLKQKGNSGREYALANFVSDICLPKVIELIESTLPNK